MKLKDWWDFKRQPSSCWRHKKNTLISTDMAMLCRSREDIDEMKTENKRREAITSRREIDTIGFKFMVLCNVVLKVAYRGVLCSYQFDSINITSWKGRFMDGQRIFNYNFSCSLYNLTAIMRLKVNMQLITIK